MMKQPLPLVAMFSELCCFAEMFTTKISQSTTRVSRIAGLLILEVLISLVGIQRGGKIILSDSTAEGVAGTTTLL